MIKWIIDSHCTCSIRHCPSSPKTSLTDVRMARCQRDKKRERRNSLHTGPQTSVLPTEVPSCRRWTQHTRTQQWCHFLRQQWKKKKRKVQGQIASDKEGMSSRAIYRHSACGEILQKKEKSDPKQKLLFLFRKVKLQFFEYITEKTFQAFGFCLAITINRWWLFHRLGHLVSS